MRLNPREREVALVAADLLEKGDPSFRIAKYCHLKKMTGRQLHTLLEKLPSMDYDGWTLRWFCYLEENPNFVDGAMAAGRRLRKEIEGYEK